MPKSKSSRKKYRPRRVEKNILGLVIPSVMMMADQAETTDIHIKMHDCMSDVAHGKGTAEDANLLLWTACITFAYTKLRAGLGKEFAADIRAGYKAARRLQLRGEKTGRFAFTEPEKKVMVRLLEIHEVQLQAATVGETYAAMDYCHAKLCAVG
jgi:hypothetical protein